MEGQRLRKQQTLNSKSNNDDLNTSNPNGQRPHFHPSQLSAHAQSPPLGTSRGHQRMYAEEMFQAVVWHYRVRLPVQSAHGNGCATAVQYRRTRFHHRLSSGLRAPKPLLHCLQAQIWHIAIAVSRPAKQGRCKCMTVKGIVRCFANSLNLVSNLIEFGQQIQ